MSLGISVLGSTGSVGVSTLKVVRQNPDRLHVVSLAAAGRQLELLAAQIEEFRPSLVAVADSSGAQRLANLVPSTEVVAGRSGLEASATHPGVGRVVAAIVGAAGLPPVAAALGAGIDVALANKESLVVAGRLLLELARDNGARLLPIDSEHAALHQGLRCGAASEVRRLTLTASGGPFRERELATWDAITPSDALRHPTWKMGKKITVDSATLMNKGLELIEASHLFGVGPERISVLIHPQSLVHSLVEYHDGSVIAQLSHNDMTVPISYALAYPERWPGTEPSLDLASFEGLHFHQLDEHRFPSVALARRALAAGDSAPAVLNAANEIAVWAFLEERIPFLRIFSCLEETLAAHRPEAVSTLEAALGWDREGRRMAREILGLEEATDSPGVKSVD